MPAILRQAAVSVLFERQDTTDSPQAQSDPDPAFYPYKPARTPAIVATSLFFTVFLLHLILLLRKRLWAALPLAIGTLVLAVSHGFRTLNTFPEVSSSDTKWYLAHQILAVSAPPLFMATIVVILITAVRAAPRPFLSSGAIKTAQILFGLFELLAFFLQALGIILVLLQNENIGNGANLAIAVGSGLQIASFILVIVLAVWLESSGGLGMLQTGGRADRALAFLAAAAMLVTVRSTFRLVIYEQNNSSDLGTKEIFYYCLQQLPMLLASIVLLLLPSRTAFKPGHRPSSSFGHRPLVSSPLSGPVHIQFQTPSQADEEDEKRRTDPSSDSDASSEATATGPPLHHEKAMPPVHMALPQHQRNARDSPPPQITFPPIASSDSSLRTFDGPFTVTSDSEDHDDAVSERTDMSSWKRFARDESVADRVVWPGKPQPPFANEGKSGEDSGSAMESLGDSSSVYSSTMQTWKSKRVGPPEKRNHFFGATRVNPALRLKPTLKVTHPTPAGSAVSSTHPMRTQWI